MRAGVIGMGLIGGSMCKAYKRDPRWEVYGANRSRSIVEFALIAQAIDGELTDEILPTLDVLFLASFPQGVVDQLKQAAPKLSKRCVVIDLSGVKEKVCGACFPIAQEYGFTFVGGHPMAGTQFSGIKYSRAELFKGASMILVPPHLDDMSFLTELKGLFLPLGFGKITITTPEKHDAIIAFTSQLAHIVSSAYIKSDTAALHHGFSAGSYRDMTRVATLNDTMWTELFLENRDNLLHELDSIITALTDYRNALEATDAERLAALLRAGTADKNRIDG